MTTYEELIEKLRCCVEQIRCGDCRYVKDCDGDRMMMSEAANAIEELTDRNVGKWIPVTERLPKDGVFVLVCNDDGHMMIAKYESETYEWYYKYTNYDFDIWDNEEQGPVCYWMPLSEPPKEE